MYKKKKTERLPTVTSHVNTPESILDQSQISSNFNQDDFERHFRNVIKLEENAEIVDNNLRNKNFETLV